MDLSVVVPVYNEEENLVPLVERIRQVLDGMGRSYEIVFVDDGSRDGTLERIRSLAREREDIRAIVFRRNYGQTAALDAGFRAARGGIVVSMDGDLQNDPGDIPALVRTLEEGGYDLVGGWRRNRHDAFLTRLVPSWLANRLIARMTDVRIHDFGCTLRAYRREILADLRLYGEMHRFLAVLVAWHGGRIAEIEVTHHPRTRGRSKYGIGRTLKVILDLLTVKFLMGYEASPSYLFGKAGMLMFLLSLLSLGGALYQKLFLGTKLHRTPLTVLALGCVIVGVLFVFQGLQAELMVRIFHQSSSRPGYSIRETLNLENPPD